MYFVSLQTVHSFCKQSGGTCRFANYGKGCTSCRPPLAPPHRRDAGATSATAAQSVYMSVYRRRWGAEFAPQGARMRIARAYLVAGQAEPAPRDPRGGGFDPGDAAAFAAASALFFSLLLIRRRWLSYEVFTWPSSVC